MSYKKHLWCFYGVRVAHVFRFLCCPIISLRSEFRVVMFVTISAYKLCSVRLYLQLFVGGLMSYLCYLCLPTYNGVQHIFCFAFLRIVYPMLPVSLDCPFFIVPFVVL